MACPADFATIFPPFTEATASLLELQLIVLSSAFSGETLAEIPMVSPFLSVKLPLLIFTDETSTTCGATGTTSFFVVTAGVFGLLVVVVGLLLFCVSLLFVFPLLLFELLFELVSLDLSVSFLLSLSFVLVV